VEGAASVERCLPAAAGRGRRSPRLGVGKTRFALKAEKSRCEGNGREPELKSYESVEIDFCRAYSAGAFFLVIHLGLADSP
jgi:hypothetical protein